MTLGIKLSPRPIKLIFVGFTTLGLALFLWFILSPDPYTSGISAIKKSNWTDAITHLSKVEVHDPYYSRACDGLRVARAHQSYESGQWNEALELARKPTEFLDFAEILSALRDSCQYHIDLEHAPTLIPHLKEVVKEGTDRATLSELLTLLGSRKAYSDYIGTNCPNARVILGFLTRLNQVDLSQSEEYHRLSSKEGELTAEISELKATLETIKSQGIRWHSFTIDKMFDTRSAEDDAQEAKGVYSGISMSEYSEIVLIASDHEIPTSVYDRMHVTLLVKPLGRKGYIKGNGYGYTANVYVPTYETVGKDMDPNLITRKIGSLGKEKAALSSSITRLQKNLEQEKSIILTVAMIDLKKSTWQ